jgi:Ser/Thr protein kinase RdoA (MazF antagonist)
VLRYRLADGTTVFGKVMTPARSRRLLALADALAGGPGARDDDAGGLQLALPLGSIGRGALVFPCAPGRSLRDLLLAGGPLPPAERLARLPTDIHRVGGPARAGAGELADLRAGRRFDPVVALVAAQMVARLLPAEAAAAGRLAEAVIACAEASEPPDEWVVHGDLYENQVLVDGDHLTLIDLDDLGPGDPLLDAANVSAHLLLLAASGGPAAAMIARYRGELRQAFGQVFDLDPADLAWREAYCLLRLVSGPFRVLHPEWPTRMAARLSLAADALGARRL